MKAQQLVAAHPLLFHMADGGAWEPIRAHGLLSTTALLDRYGVPEPARARIEADIRPASVRLSDPELGTAVIRDNRPLRRAVLESVSDIGVDEYCRMLNRRVFLWATERRLRGHLLSAGHRGRTRDVISVSTAALLDRHVDRVTISPINSGSALYGNSPRRGPETFSALSAFPYGEWTRRRSRRRAVVEVCVEYAVPDVEDVAVEAIRVHGDGRREVLWVPDGRQRRSHPR